jgi:phosphoglycerate dehydrogenase-like enzyme
VNILVGDIIPEELRAGIVEAAGSDHTVIFAEERDDIAKHGPDADVFYGYVTERATAHLSNVKWVHTWSAGVDKHLFPALADPDVVLTNGAGTFGPQVADHTFALLLALARGLHAFMPRKPHKNWEGAAPHIDDIQGFTVCILGMGGIGTHIAQRAKGFSMHVIGVDAYRTDKPDVVDELVSLDGLKDAIGRADAVLIACPLTPETRGLVDADMLAAMKPTAYFVNCARGGVVDEGALIEVLRDERIAGAGLDVTEVEPLPEDSPLWDLPNVILTPHRASSSQNRLGRLVDLFAENLRRYVADEPLLNVVRKDLGF